MLERCGGRGCISCVGKLQEFGQSQLQNGEERLGFVRFEMFTALLLDPEDEGSIDSSECQESLSTDTVSQWGRLVSLESGLSWNLL
jgi:hypothetical protein